MACFHVCHSAKKMTCLHAMVGVRGDNMVCSSLFTLVVVSQSIVLETFSFTFIVSHYDKILCLLALKGDGIPSPLINFEH